MTNKKNSPIPKNVTIDPLKYSVNVVSDEFIADSWFGQIFTSKQKILIAEGIHLDQEQITLVHEIMHGLLNGMGELDKSNDEKFVHAFSERLLSLVKTNPKLINYLSSTER